MPTNDTAPDLRGTAFALAFIPFAVYIQSEPAPGTARTLSWLLDHSHAWGWFLVACGLVALVCSFRSSWLRAGHQVVMFGAGVWATCLLVGFVDGRASWAAAASACFYGFLAFVAYRDLARA